MKFARVHWFMEKYRSCNHTRDGSGPGFIWIPKEKGLDWPPPLKLDPEVDLEPFEVPAEARPAE